MYTHLNYIKRNQSTLAKAKAFLGYIGRRPGREKAQMERILFGHGGKLTAEQAEEMLKNAPKNTYFWRLIISPDPNSEDKDKNLDMWDLTREAVMWLEQRLGTNGTPRDIPFIGAEHHYDHTEIKHIHAILLIQRRGREMLITPQILNEFREATRGKAFLQKDSRELALEQERTPQIEQSIDEPTLEVGSSSVETDTDAGVMAPFHSSCPDCPQGTISKRLNSRVYECNRCGYAIKNGVVLRRGREAAYELERSF